MSSVPPGYVKCSKNPEHIYPSNLDGCDICAQQKNQAAQLSLVGEESEHKADPISMVGLGIFVLFFATIAFFAFHGAQNTPAEAVAKNESLPPVQRALANTYQGVLATYAPQAKEAPRPVFVPVKEVGQDGKRTTVKPQLPVNTAADASGLVGNWRMRAGKEGTALGECQVNYQDGHISLKWSNKRGRGALSNVESIWYDGHSWRLSGSYGSLTHDDFDLEMVGPNHYAGFIYTSGQRMARVDFTKSSP